jgi:ATP-dependent Lon protease
MKILFPQGGAAKEEIEELLKFAIEGRKRVKDQLMRIDSTYANVHFTYQDTSGQARLVTTLEEEEYPHEYQNKRGQVSGDRGQEIEPAPSPCTLIPDTCTLLPDTCTLSPAPLSEGHLVFQENQRGISFDTLLGPYLRGASRITITDPYIRLFYQMRNLMEFLETVVKHKPKEEEIAVHLITTEDEFKSDQQKENFLKIKESCGTVGIEFTWEFDATGTIHARHIVTDHGWKILLDRGLDIFQHYEMNDAFTFANRLQQYRPCKAFEVTFISYNLEQPVDQTMIC